MQSVSLPNQLTVGTHPLSLLGLRLYHRGLGGLAFRVAAALADPWRESVSDSPALCSPSAEAYGAEKASKSKLRSLLRQLPFHVLYLGEWQADLSALCRAQGGPQETGLMASELGSGTPGFSWSLRGRPALRCAADSCCRMREHGSWEHRRMKEGQAVAAIKPSGKQSVSGLDRFC